MKKRSCVADHITFLEPGILRFFPHLLKLSSKTQSPGALSYFQNVHPLQLRRLQATAAETEGDKYFFPPKRIVPSRITCAVIILPL